MMKQFILILLFIMLHLQQSFSQSFEVYCPWKNDLSKLVKTNKNDVMPLLKNGSNYRIIKIRDFQGNRINKVVFQSTTTKIQLFQLPQIKNYQNEDILDLMVPIKSNTLLEGRGKDKYFLIKFSGIKPGTEVNQVRIISNLASYSIQIMSKTAFIANNANMDLNVWSYFNNNYLVDSVKAQVINDLVSHSVTALVIHPNAMPPSNNVSQNKIQALKAYLQGASNKFKYYLLTGTAGYDIMSPQWQKYFPVWYKKITLALDSLGIKNDQIIFYPFDEPRGANIQKLKDMYTFVRSLGIKNKFYVTLSNIESASLASSIDIVQVRTDGVNNLIDAVNSYKQASTEIWIYETNFGYSRSNAPLKYLRIGMKANKYLASGIGVWAYADVQRSVDINNIKEYYLGKGTWNIIPSKKQFDYSLIYRQGNKIYSSLRWEALHQGMEENFWIKLYNKKYGPIQTNLLTTKMLSDQFDCGEWENIKLKLIN